MRKWVDQLYRSLDRSCTRALGNILFCCMNWAFPRKVDEKFWSSAKMEHLKTVASGGASAKVVESGAPLSLAVMALRRTKSCMARSFGLGRVS